MKLIIKNIGVLKDTSIELGDLTVIFGKPNSGKSYILKSIYSNLAFFDQANNVDLASIVGEGLYPEIVSISEKAINEGKYYATSLNITERFLEALTVLTERISRSLLSVNETEIVCKNSNLLNRIKEITKEVLTSLSTPSVTYTPYSPYCVNKIGVGFSKGELILSVEVSSIGDKELCKTLVSSNLISTINSYMASYLVPAIMNKVSMAVEIPSVRFLSYGRSLILLYRENIRPLPYTKSLIFWINKGIERIRSGKGSINNFWDLRVGVEKTLSVNGFGIPFLSSSLQELTAFSLAIADGRKSLLLIEEPESQLSTDYQLKMGLFLYELSKKHKVVVTTHSEIILIILAILSHFKKEKEVAELFNIGKVESEERSVDVKIYYANDGKIELMDPEKVLENIPGITDIYYSLLKVIAKLSE